MKYKDWFEKPVQKKPFGFEEFLTCIDNMDSSNVSELKIIQESSDAAAKDLDRLMYSGPENGPEHGMQVRLLSIQGFRSEMDLKTSPIRTTKS